MESITLDRALLGLVFAVLSGLMLWIFKTGGPLRDHFTKLEHALETLTGAVTGLEKTVATADAHAEATSARVVRNEVRLDAHDARLRALELAVVRLQGKRGNVEAGL